MMRVQIPAYTDRWMMGDRYGTVENIRWMMLAGKTTKAKIKTEVAYVRLDKSKKKQKFILADCTVIE